MAGDAHLEDYIDHIQPKAASSLMLWVISAFFVLFLLWASFTQLDRTVRGIGRVISSSQLQVVSNLEGGVVDAILVKTGQLVRAGAELVRLNRTQARADFGSGEATLNALRVKIARLEAEVHGRSPVFPTSEDRVLNEQIAIERSLYSSRMADFNSLSSAASARVRQAQSAVGEAQASHAARIAARNAAERELVMIRPLVERGIEPSLSLVRAESAAAAAASDVMAASASISRAHASLSESRAALAQVQQEWRSKAADELAAAQGELAARRSALPALADRMRRTIVRAPLAGRINRVLVTTVGSAIRPGDPLVEIVPEQESLLIEAKVNPKDIASVRLGQDAKVDITAYEAAVYGSLKGHVVAISPDAVLDQRTGESFYLVQVRTTGDRSGAGRRLPIGPGMIADIALLGDKRSVLAYLLTPITRLRDRALRE